MTEDNAVNTDWLADSAYSYGYGYTKEQALMAMARASPRTVDESVTIDLVEHIGSAKTGMGGWQVDEFVSGERIALSPEQFNEIRKTASKALSAVELAIDDPESVEELDF